MKKGAFDNFFRGAFFMAIVLNCFAKMMKIQKIHSFLYF
jgi:hypothetical protein